MRCSAPVLTNRNSITTKQSSHEHLSEYFLKTWQGIGCHDRNCIFSDIMGDLPTALPTKEPAQILSAMTWN